MNINVTEIVEATIQKLEEEKTIEKVIGAEDGDDFDTELECSDSDD